MVYERAQKARGLQRGVTQSLADSKGVPERQGSSVQAERRGSMAPNPPSQKFHSMHGLALPPPLATHGR